MGMFEDMLRERPSMSLEDALWVVWDDYPSDFNTYWGLDISRAPASANAAASST